MKKKILLAVDDSNHSKHAIRFAARMKQHVSELNYVLFHVQPALSDFLLEEAKRDPKTRSSLDRMKEKKTETAMSFLRGLRTRMVETGVPKDVVELVTHPQKIGLAKDIIDYAQEKRYDAIVVGRRGLSRFQEVFMGSLTANLLEHSRVIPVWVVDGETAPGKILLAVDGSESALRAVDHLGYILKGSADAEITMFYVPQKAKDLCSINFDEEDRELEELILKGEGNRMDAFVIDALKKFKEAGIEERQVTVKKGKMGARPGKAIVEEGTKGGYGTVVMGRRGVNRSFFMGSVSKYVLDNIQGRAIWLVS